jgi:hypothetical protein
MDIETNTEKSTPTVFFRLFGAQPVAFEPQVAANLDHQARRVQFAAARRYARIFAPHPHYAPASATLHGDLHAAQRRNS